jgi:hypothetical protein
MQKRRLMNVKGAILFCAKLVMKKIYGVVVVATELECAMSSVTTLVMVGQNLSTIISFLKFAQTVQSNVIPVRETFAP